jgi:hypothetical protein
MVPWRWPAGVELRRRALSDPEYSELMLLVTLLALALYLVWIMWGRPMIVTGYVVVSVEGEYSQIIESPYVFADREAAAHYVVVLESLSLRPGRRYFVGKLVRVDS